MKVLLVDDDPVVLEVTAAVLRGLGHEVLTREHALGTTAFIHRVKPDVALIDIEMPGLAGDEIVKIAREEAPTAAGANTAFILYSGRDPAELQRLVEKSGACGAIHKSSGAAGLATQFNAIIEML